MTVIHNYLNSVLSDPSGRHNKHTYVSNSRTPKYMKQKWTELKGEIEHLTVIFGNFNTLLSIKNGITRQEIEKEINRSILEGVCPSISFLGTLISYPLLKISASQDTTAW